MGKAGEEQDPSAEPAVSIKAREPEGGAVRPTAQQPEVNRHRPPSEPAREMNEEHGRALVVGMHTSAEAFHPARSHKAHGLDFDTVEDIVHPDIILVRSTRCRERLP